MDTTYDPRRPAAEHPLTVLIVEDDPALRRGLELQLGHMGHLVISASRAGQVAAMLSGFVVDLVLSDHRLPDGDSRDVFDAVAAFAPGVPVILMSGFLDDEQSSDALNAGFAACLPKPIDTLRLQRAAWLAMGRPF